jgi:hypothetical protein
MGYCPKVLIDTRGEQVSEKSVSFARAYVRFFSRLPDRLMGYRVDNIQCNHCISEHAQCPSCMPLRGWTTTQSSPMGFFFSSDVSTMDIGHRFSRERFFQTFFNQSFSDELDFLC